MYVFRASPSASVGKAPSCSGCRRAAPLSSAPFSRPYVACPRAGSRSGGHSSAYTGNSAPVRRGPQPSGRTSLRGRETRASLLRSCTPATLAPPFHQPLPTHRPSLHSCGGRGRSLYRRRPGRLRSQSASQPATTVRRTSAPAVAGRCDGGIGRRCFGTHRWWSSC